MSKISVEGGRTISVFGKDITLSNDAAFIETENFNHSLDSIVPDDDGKARFKIIKNNGNFHIFECYKKDDKVYAWYFYTSRTIFQGKVLEKKNIVNVEYNDSIKDFDLSKNFFSIKT